MTVFWDKRISPGPFDEILEHEIEECEYFVPIMTPSSTRENSYCRRELQHAKKYKKTIVPVRIFEDHTDKTLEGVYTYASFTGDFEKGFLRLTALILRKECFSWEYLGGSDIDDGQLLDALEKGLLPVFIAQQIGDWVLVDRLWPYAVKQFSYEGIVTKTPQTPQAVLEQIGPSMKRLSQQLDGIGLWVVEAVVQPIVVKFLDVEHTNPQNEYAEAGKKAKEAVDQVRQALCTMAGAKLDALEVDRIQRHFYSEVADRLRYIIKLHSQRK